MSVTITVPTSQEEIFLDALKSLYPKRNIVRWIALRLSKSATVNLGESEPQDGNYWGRPARCIRASQPRAR